MVLPVAHELVGICKDVSLRCTLNTKGQSHQAGNIWKLSYEVMKGLSKVLLVSVFWKRCPFLELNQNIALNTLYPCLFPLWFMGSWVCLRPLVMIFGGKTRVGKMWIPQKLHVKCKSKQDGKWLLWKKTRAVALAQAPRIPLPPLQIAGVLKGHTVSCFFWLRDDCGGVPEVAFNISFTDEDTPPRDVETDIFRQISMPIDDRIISWSHANLLLGTFSFGFLPSIFVAEN